jgi:hypothetical protein
MSGIDAVPRFLSALHSLPLWILVGLAAAGYATLFVPSFGGADLVVFREKWAWVCWLDAVVFTILSVACAVDLTIKERGRRKKKRLEHERNLYLQVYAPLYDELNEIRASASTAIMAPFFSIRVKNALRRWRYTRNKWVAIRISWIELFDRKETKPTGDVEYGGSFPLSKIERVVRANLAFCDDQLAELTRSAVDYRREEHVHEGMVTTDDLALWDHIVDQRNRLKKNIYG